MSWRARRLRRQREPGGSLLTSAVNTPNAFLFLVQPPRTAAAAAVVAGGGWLRGCGGLGGGLCPASLALRLGAACSTAPSPRRASSSCTQPSASPAGAGCGPLRTHAALGSPCLQGFGCKVWCPVPKGTAGAAAPVLELAELRGGWCQPDLGCLGGTWRCRGAPWEASRLRPATRPSSR